MEGSFDEFRSRISAGDRARIGNEIGPGHAASVLFAMRAERLMPVPLPNALIGSLTAEPTLAASFGVFDVQAGEWHRDLIAALGLDRVDWPRITRWSEAVAGFEGIPIYAPIGDQQAAVRGVSLAENELSINIGTGSQVSVLSDTFRTGSFKVRPYFDGLYLETVTHLPAGRALNVLLRMLGRHSWDGIDEAVDELVKTDVAVDLSFYPSAFGSRGRIENLTETNATIGHIFLAAFESMAANYATAARMLFPGEEWGSLVLSGGLAHKSARLRALIANALARDTRLSANTEETLLGLAALAREALK